MDQKKLKIYTASSVGIDYFFFLSRTIENAGFQVNPIFLITETEYRKLAKNSGFKKIWLRIKMYLFYPIYLIWEGFKADKGSIFVISSNTFFAPLLMHFLLRFKRVKVIHMLYDLFPDALEIAGAIKIDSKISRWIGKITQLNLQKCDTTIFLGSYLKEHAENRWGVTNKADVIDISTDLALYDEKISTLNKTSKIIVHYGGQLGHLHDAKSIIESIRYVLKSDLGDLVEFNFYVSGAQANFLEKSLNGLPVKIISAIPSYQWRQDIREFHIGLVSLSPGGASVCLPSKTYGMMAGGMAIMAICPVWSDLGKIINNLNAGWVINNSSFLSTKELKVGNYNQNLRSEIDKKIVASEFYDCLKVIIANRDLLEEKRRGAFNGVRSNYNINVLSNKWKEVILHS